jgi:ABC-2 type transport system ATP-binding protein
MKYAIEFEAVTKVYRTGILGRRHTGLSELSLKVPEGSVFGFLGANGAGKTTAIKVLMGLHFATKGNVKILGSELGNTQAKERVGYMPERPSFHAELTGIEFLNFHRGLFSSRKLDNKLSNEALLDLVGIADAGNRLLREYSKGMLQRIGIAQALVNSPDLVVLDEPMSGLDPVGRRDVRLLIDRLAREGRTVFFSTHILSDVETLCDQIAFLEQGKLTAQGSVDEILSSRKNYSKELVFEEISEADIKSTPVLERAKKFGTAWKINTRSHEEAKEVIGAVWTKKGKIVSMTNPHLSLEAALFPLEKE